jgi:hypothetical protein
MIALTALRTGRHAVGPENGKMQVRTYREGIAQKVDHDLVMDVGQRQATVQVGEDSEISSIEVDVDSRCRCEKVFTESSR